MSGVSLEELGDSQEPRDFRRANGAPMVHRPDGSGKWDRYSRPSSMGGNLDDESNLVNWKIDRAMDGVASAPSLAAAVIAKAGVKEGRKDLREKAIQAGRGEEAADLGTALHAITERYEQEPGFKVPPPFDADIAAYVALLDEMGLESAFIECKIVSDRWRAAGTADRIYRARKRIWVGPGIPPIEPGQMLLGDLKTGARLDYSFRAFCIQTTIYVDGEFYDVETNERSPLPPEMRTDVAVLMHMPAGGASCEAHWVDCEVGREGIEIVKLLRNWRKRTDQVLAHVPEPVSEAEAVAGLTEELPSVDLPGTWPTDDITWRDAMLPFAQSRIIRLGKYSNEARALLLRKWPEHVKPLTLALPEPVDLAYVLDLLDVIEAAHSVPWNEGDPRSQWNAHLHEDAIVRSNQPPSQIHGATQP